MSVCLRERSPSYIPPSCGTVWCDSSTKHDEVVREVVDERERVRARRAALEDARVVLDPGAEAELLHHLEVVLGALADPVRLEHAALGLELRDLLLELGAQLVDRALDRRLRGDVLGRRPDDEVVETRVHLARDRVEVRDLLHLVAEERDAVGRLDVRRLHLDDVALDAEAPAPENGVVAHVLALDELAQHLVAVVAPPRPRGSARARATPPASRGRRCTRPTRRRRRRAASGATRSPRAAAARCRRSATSPSRCRGRPAGRTPRAGSSRSTRRSTRPRSPGRTRGTRCRAARRASCCAR